MWLSAFADQNVNQGPPPQNGRPRPANERPPQNPQQGDEFDEEEEEEEDVQSAFAQAMASMGPWAASALAHLALIVIAILIVWSVKTQLEEEKVIIPDATFSENPGAPLTVQTTETKMQTTMARKSLVKATNQSAPSKLVKNTSSISFSGGGMASGNPFGATLGTGTGPFANKFMGMGGNARKIAYLIDASGSLIDTLPFVISELKRSISKLSDQQSFTVIFFQGNRVIEWSSGGSGGGRGRGLRPATQENKQKASIWIDPQSGNVVPMGESNPINAIKTVLNYRPELLYILSDNITGSGRWEIRQQDLIEAYKRANVGRTKINAIQFLYEDPLVHLKDKDGNKMQPTLQLIAEQSGGKYKFVSAGELGVDLP